ncbi:lanthionine synthetase LanC family protein [Actinomycetospora termitidis]|uniref:Lanthionine synthetase LanC family protein n=1 Tax=Actinomycetospora termitidis TaxID=3053470 RepID=A0ABT7MD75_9PSEU|nr:lanthionine synthetase LanC family protein [Actinomycetospora sp. Odt1-22]MDL5157333.1 lanthionine synthetase LanC family protein [Actinomycetospora sp. Odt1-22]
MSRLVLLVAVVALLAGCSTTAGGGSGGSDGVDGSGGSPSPVAAPAAPGVGRGVDALIAAAEKGPDGGSVWPSVIQAPHRQVDRDVGAAGIAAGLLAVAEGSPDAGVRDRARDTARDAADFLVVAQRGAGRFPDYVDPDGPAGYAYSSYDDGAAGVADLLWQVGERTGEQRYRDVALDAAAWLVERAEDVPGAPACPAVCRWAWSDDGAPSYRNGMGEGQAGIVYALSVLGERTGDRRLAQYAAAGGAYLLSQQGPDGGMPERADQPARNTGFLSGAAGAAFTFLRLHQATGEQRWRDGASRALAFLDRTAVPAAGGSTWPIWVDASGVPGNARRATGMEEGAAGIGWVSLQAAELLGDESHRERAEAAGRWLLAVGRPVEGGTAWPEFEGSPITHLSTNSGAAGTGWYLDTLGRVTGDEDFRDAARAAQGWLVATMRPDGTWPSNLTDGRPRLLGEPSWHWGSAGILAFLTRMSGGPVDSPGMQPPLVPLE